MKLLPLLILASLILIAGCTFDIEASVKSIPAVDAFLQEHPDAEITIVLVDAATSGVTDTCEGTSPAEGRVYLARIIESSQEIDAVLDSTSGQLLCLKRTGMDSDDDQDIDESERSRDKKACEAEGKYWNECPSMGTITVCGEPRCEEWPPKDACSGLDARECSLNKECQPVYSEGDCQISDGHKVCNSRYEGCKERQEEVCSKEYQPVCGSDGHTYINACFAEREGIKVISKGECTKIDPTPVPPMPTPTPIIDMEALMDDDTVLGDRSAPIIMIEWGDYECPFCKRFHDETFDQIKENYIDEGKVRFVFRDFPLSSIHPNAQLAAEASECADDQGRFWDMHELLFEEGVEGGLSTYKHYADDLGMDTVVFSACMDRHSQAAEVAHDFKDGENVGVSGTPTFLINGQMVAGAQPYASFVQIFDDLGPESTGSSSQTQPVYG